MGDLKVCVVVMFFVSTILLPGRGKALTLDSGEELQAIQSTPEQAAALGLVPGSPSLRGVRWTGTSPNPSNWFPLIQDLDTGELSANLSDGFVGWISGMGIGSTGTFIIRTTRPTGTTTSTKIKFDGSCFYLNDSTTPFDCSSTFLIFAQPFPTRCQQTALGAWRIFSSWDEFSDGTGVSDPFHDINFKIKASGVGTLSISSNTILPFIPAETPANCASNPQAMGVAPYDEALQAGGSTRIRILVRDPVCNIAVPGVKVTGDLTRQTGTGGHVHTGLLQHVIDVVAITAVQITKNPESVTFSGTTDASGVVEIEARGGEAASGIIVNATVEQPQGTMQALTGAFVVKQADFAELPTPSGSSSYTLAGITGIHPKNHFGTSSLISAIDQLATATKQGTKRLLLPDGLCLAVDDMSLEHGAVFDIDHLKGATGTEPHCTHRRGVDFDVLGFADCGNTTGAVRAGVQGKSKVEQLVLRESGKVLLNKLIKGKQLPLTPANEQTLHYRVSP